MAQSNQSITVGDFLPRLYNIKNLMGGIFMSETSDMIRKMFGQGDEIRDEGLTTPADVERFDDILYGEDKQWQVLDVYRPKAAKDKKLPVIVSVHGGGWVYGDKERYQYYCMSLARHQFAVVNFTYRLAPEHVYPAPVCDTNMVMSWIMDNAKEYGFDTEYIFAVGDSAGANILGLYSAICTNPDYAKNYSLEIPKDFKLKAIALNCGAYHIDVEGEAGKQTKMIMQDYLAGGGTKEELELISVENHITGDYPPTYFMTCSGDFLMEQAKVLQNKLMECQIQHEFHFWGNNKTKLGHVFHLNMKLDMAHKCNKEQCEFFKSFIKEE